MNLKFFALLFSLYFFSFCTPYWENESLNEINHQEITNEASKDISLTTGNFQSENNLKSSAQKLELQTKELTEAIDNLLTDFNEL